MQKTKNPKRKKINVIFVFLYDLWKKTRYKVVVLCEEQERFHHAALSGCSTYTLQLVPVCCPTRNMKTHRLTLNHVLHDSVLPSATVKDEKKLFMGMTEAVVWHH